MIFSNKKAQQAHLLKPTEHDNFSNDPEWVVLGELTHQLVFLELLKKLKIKRNFLFILPVPLENLPSSFRKPPRNLQFISDQIIAMTEKTGGWVLRAASGKSYYAQSCFILEHPHLPLKNLDHLLFQSLINPGYIQIETPTQDNPSGLIQNADGSVVSKHPRVNEKLFFLPHPTKDSPIALSVFLTEFLQKFH